MYTPGFHMLMARIQAVTVQLPAACYACVRYCVMRQLPGQDLLRLVMPVLVSYQCTLAAAAA